MFVRNTNDVCSTSLFVDIVAMFFGMPQALFPAIADHMGGASILGLLYAAPALGALLATATSGWATRVRRHDLRRLGEMPCPLEARRRRGPLGRGRRLLGDEGALPHVRPSPAAGDEVLVRLRDGRPIHAQVAREIPRGGQLHSRREQPLADEALQMQLDLARQRQAALAILGPV